MIATRLEFEMPSVIRWMNERPNLNKGEVSTHSLTRSIVSARFGLNVKELLGRMGQSAEEEEDGGGDNDGMRQVTHFW